jgi:hypothetical protein
MGESLNVSIELNVLFFTTSNWGGVFTWVALFLFGLGASLV